MNNPADCARAEGGRQKLVSIWTVSSKRDLRMVGFGNQMRKDFHELMPQWKKDAAKQMRRHQTPAEEKFWTLACSGKNRRFFGCRIYRQVPIHGYIADFYCSKAELVIEIDGQIHAQRVYEDTFRDKVLKRELGVKTIRLTNKEVLENWPSVVARVQAEIDERIAHAARLKKEREADLLRTLEAIGSERD